MRLSWLPVLALGCSAETSLAPDEDGDAPAPLDSGAMETEDPGTDTLEPLEPPVYWSLQAVAVVQGGALDPAATAVQLRTWSAEPAPLCAWDLVLLDAVDATLDDPDLTPVAWWSWTLDAGAAAGDCPEWPARTLELGLGPYDSRLAPAIAARGWEALELYGLYVREEPSSPLYVIGVGGTADHLAGLAAPVQTPPLPDGQYELHTLILLDLP